MTRSNIIKMLNSEFVPTFLDEHKQKRLDQLFILGYRFPIYVSINDTFSGSIADHTPPSIDTIIRTNVPVRPPFAEPSAVENNPSPSALIAKALLGHELCIHTDDRSDQIPVTV